MTTEAEPQSDWAPRKGPLMTRWAKDVSPSNVHPEYPRPTMVRKDWMNLNGLWDMEILRGGSQSEKAKILVPFPVEAALSGVMKPVGPEDTLRYRRSFTIPAPWKGKRILLHFGAVDWESRVLVNGKEVGSHKGGYDGFSFDVTDALEASVDQVLEVFVRDPSETSFQPHGKQYIKNEGIWYTPSSGIWQTVWLEPVPNRHIDHLRIASDSQFATLSVHTSPQLDAEWPIRVTLSHQGKVIQKLDSKTFADIRLKPEDVKLWSPESPNLYGLKVELLEAGQVVDSVDSYCAFRTISLGKDDRGRTRIFLNGKPYFLIGPLDQGFWPDGLYTAPTDKALKYDLDITKKFGFNFIRKHVKVEPERWYSYCDRMGFLVFQDMPSGDKYIGGNDPDIERTPESGENFKNELRAMIEGKFNHPCIVAWVPYNEGWGQWKTAETTNYIRKLDPTRLIDSTTGWTDRGVGDMHDIHAYPGPASPKPEAKRAAFLGEFGGLGLPMPGHMWKETGWGYRSFKTQQELTEGFVGLLQNLRFLIDDPGCSGAVYTQTTDVETELNGLMTYDREVIKPDIKEVAKAVKALFGPPPVVRVVTPTSEEKGIDWSYRTDLTDRTDRTWTLSGQGWKSAPAGFGTQGTPGAVVRTVWNTSDIWLRREFLLPKIALKNPHLRIHHDEDVEVYLDGKLLLKRSGYTTGYVLVPIPKSGARSLAPGRHTLAVHCHQTNGGQYIDVGIVDVAG